MKTLFKCEGCGLVDDTQAVIEACEAYQPASIGMEPGQVFAIQNYGWWNDDESWFLPEPGAEPGSGANGSGRPGRPLYVVLDVVPKYDPRIETTTSPGRWLHELVAIVYSPRHANSLSGRRIAWTTPNGHYRGELIKTLDRAEFDRLRTEAYGYLEAGDGRIRLL